jgi:hypothetical protein
MEKKNSRVSSTLKLIVLSNEVSLDSLFHRVHLTATSAYLGVS